MAAPLSSLKSVPIECDYCGRTEQKWKSLGKEEVVIFSEEDGTLATYCSEVCEKANSVFLRSTGFFRFPHIWEHAFKCSLFKPNGSVLLLNPTVVGAGKNSICPEHLEAALFLHPDSKLIASSGNNTLDQAIGRTFHAEANKIISETINQNPYLISKGLAKQLGSNKIKTIDDAVIRLRIDRLSPFEKNYFDLIFAPLSFSSALIKMAASGKDKDGTKRIKLLGSHLSTLKPGRVMYVDQNAIRALLLTPEDISNEKDGHAIDKKKVNEIDIINLISQIFQTTGIKTEFRGINPPKACDRKKGPPAVTQVYTGERVDIETLPVFAITRLK